MQRNVHVLVWTVNEYPRIYRPVSGPANSSAPVLAFHKPGHYRSVINEPGYVSLNA